MSKRADFMSRKSKNCTILDTKKVEFWTSEISTFWRFPEKSRNLENLENLQKSRKSRKSRKISKIAKISKISKISTFWPSGGYPTDLAGIAIRRSIWPLWRVCPEGQICCLETKILDFPETKKSAKISIFLTPQKVENLSWLPWRSIVAPRGRNRSSEGKKVHFFRLFGG